MEQPCLIGISENQTVTLENIRPSSIILNDPLINQQGHLNFVNYRLSIPLQEQITTPVVVAVVDSGIDRNHPDLQNRLWDNGQGNPGISFAENTNTNDFSDKSSHGTHVAGIIAAEQNNRGIAGLNHDFVQIMVVRVFNGSQATIPIIYNGIRYAIERGADVINLSLSTDISNATLNQAVIEAVNAGIFVTMAASNDAREVSNTFCPSPACIGHSLDGGLSVGSVDTRTGKSFKFFKFFIKFCGNRSPRFRIKFPQDGEYFPRWPTAAYGVEKVEHPWQPLLLVPQRLFLLVILKPVMSVIHPRPLRHF